MRVDYLLLTLWGQFRGEDAAQYAQRKGARSTRPHARTNADGSKEAGRRVTRRIPWMDDLRNESTTRARRGKEKFKK